MKKLISSIAVILISLTVTAQTSLTKVSFVNEEVENISAFNGNQNFSFTTMDEHSKYSSSTLSLVGTNSSGYNDVDGSQSATGDSLCVQNNHYGMANGDIKYGPAVISTHSSLPIKDIAENPSNGDVYTIVTLGAGSDIYVYHIQDGSITSIFDFGSVPTMSQQYLTSYETITYFEDGGNQYLFLTGEFELGPGSFVDYLIFDITGLANGDEITTIHNGIDVVQSVEYSEADGLYYILEGDNNIYKLDGGLGSLDYMLDGGTHNAVYEVTMSSTINNFTVNGLTGAGFRVFVATNDGVYTNDVSLNVEDEELAFGDVSLYPNPNNGNFTINNLDSETNIAVVTTSGQVVYSEVANYSTSVSLDMNLPNGIYFVQLSNGTSNKTIKFVKQ